MSTLFLVATPIGNLEDITMRAVRILGEVGLIAAEDTRRTRVLLNHFDINSRLISYHEHNKLIRVDTILDALEKGDVALVSDAGTPALNDPGYLLVKTVLERGFQVSPIPGPSAPLAALVASGLPTDKFTYLGYFPRKRSERIRHLEEMKNIHQTLVYLESPNRLMKTLVDLLDIFGDRKIAIARELTKIHEEIFRGALSDAVVHFEEYPPRGEITIVIAGALAEDNKWLSDQVIESIKESLGLGKAPSEIAKELAKASGWLRRDVYNLITEAQKNP